MHDAIIVSPQLKRIKASGMREAVAWEMAPFGDVEDDGSYLCWDWYRIGGRFTGVIDGDEDILQVKDLRLETLRKVKREAFTQEFHQSIAWPDGRREAIYGIKPNDTLETYVQRWIGKNPLFAGAFLRNRHWHESRMPECEIADMQEPKADQEKRFAKRCNKDPKTGSQLVVWNEPYEVWREHFYDRFIKPLGPDEYLVSVDMHA